jgi:hypothetical protein
VCQDDYAIPWHASVATGACRLDIGFAVLGALFIMARAILLHRHAGETVGLVRIVYTALGHLGFEEAGQLNNCARVAESNGVRRARSHLIGTTLSATDAFTIKTPRWARVASAEAAKEFNRA